MYLSKGLKLNRIVMVDVDSNSHLKLRLWTVDTDSHSNAKFLPKQTNDAGLWSDVELPPLRLDRKVVDTDTDSEMDAPRRQTLRKETIQHSKPTHLRMPLNCIPTASAHDVPDVDSGYCEQTAPA